MSQKQSKNQCVGQFEGYETLTRFNNLGEMMTQWGLIAWSLIFHYIRVRDVLAVVLGQIINRKAGKSFYRWLRVEMLLKYCNNKLYSGHCGIRLYVVLSQTLRHITHISVFSFLWVKWIRGTFFFGKLIRFSCCCGVSLNIVNRSVMWSFLGLFSNTLSWGGIF